MTAPSSRPDTPDCPRCGSPGASFSTHPCNPPDTPAQQHADTAGVDILAVAEKFAPEVVYLHLKDLLAEVERLTAERDEAMASNAVFMSDEAYSRLHDAWHVEQERAEAAEALAERRGEALRQIKPLVTGDLPPLTPLPMTMRCVRIADIIDAALADEGQA